MHSKPLIRSSVLVLIYLSACGLMPPSRPAPLPIASPPGAWMIKLKQSGGFAGVSLTIQVSSDGQVRVEDQRSGRSKNAELPSETMAELNRLLAQATLASTGPSPSGCADCFIYDLDLSSSSETVHIHADDTSIGYSGAQALVNFLRQLRDETLATAP